MWGFFLFSFLFFIEREIEGRKRESEIGGRHWSTSIKSPMSFMSNEKNREKELETERGNCGEIFLERERVRADHEGFYIERVGLWAVAGSERKGKRDGQCTERRAEKGKGVAGVRASAHNTLL